jgi:hypothetical protein
MHTSTNYLCKYKDIFGKPNKGIHSIRFLNIAVVDFFMTVAIAFFIAKFYDLPFYKIFILLIIFAIVIHKIFCVDTALNKLILS